MKDLNYIFKRILIGVGIILVLSFIRGNKVKAYESVNMAFDVASYSYVNNDTSNTLLASSGYQKVFANSDGFYFVCWTNLTNCQVFKPSNYFTFDTIGIQLYNSASDSDVLNIFFTNDNGVLPTMSTGANFYVNFKSRTMQVKFEKVGSSLLQKNVVIGNADTSGINTSGYRTYYNYYATRNWSPYSGRTATLIEFPQPSTSTIESLQPAKITNNNVITGYIFRPKFTNFNTDSYVYQYKVGKDSSRWLSLTENEQQIKINNNTILYVRIKNKNSNEVVDSQTFTITDISKFYNEQDYNITFSGEYRTKNYLNDNISSKSQSIIQEYQIYVDYTPKTSILKYQYQYVKNGDSLNNDNWQNVAVADNGSFTYVATENGTLYARILDSSDIILYSATFTVNNIGLLAFDSNEKGVDNFFTKLSNKIGYGGPISNLFRIPIDILNKIYSYSSYSCSPYKVSTLLGTDFVLPCYNFRETFGDTYYTLFDSLLCFVLSLCLFKFVRNIYDKFINMEDISS